MIDFDIQNELSSNLSPGEKLLWTGRPRKGVLLRSNDIFLIPFSLFWMGFVIFWETSAARSGAPTFFLLFGIPFVVMGLYLTLGRFFIDARKRANTIYGITDQRILIKTSGRGSNIKSLNIKTLSDITFSQKADGSGT